MSEQDIKSLGAKKDVDITGNDYYFLRVREGEDYCFQNDGEDWYAWRYGSKYQSIYRGIETFKKLIQ